MAELLFYFNALNSTSFASVNMFDIAIAQLAHALCSVPKYYVEYYEGFMQCDMLYTQQDITPYEGLIKGY